MLDFKSSELQMRTMILCPPLPARPRQVAYLSNLAVRKDWRGRGLGGDLVCACERIFNTPIPLAYSRHTSRFLTLYVELSEESGDAGLWTCVPKIHALVHCAEQAGANPAMEWNYADEGAIGEATRHARFTNVQRMDTALVNRYALLARFDF